METSIDEDIESETAPVSTGEPTRKWFYGWLMLPLAMLAMFASSPGQTFGVSIFNESIRESLKLSESQLAAAYLWGTILGSLPISYMGTQMDRFGIRAVMLFSLTAFSLACLVIPLVSNWLGLAFSFFLLRMLGPGTLAFLSSNVLAFWFQKRLGSVESIRALSAPASIAIVPMINVWLLGAVGWRMAYLIWGIGLWAVLFPVFFLFFRNHPEDVGQAVDHGETTPVATPDIVPENLPELTLGDALKTPVFYVLTTGTGLFAMIATAITFFLVSIVGEYHMDEKVAAQVMTVSATMMGIATLTGGFLADRMAPRVLVFLGLAGFGAAVFSLRFAETPILASVSGALLGLSQGLFFSSTQPLWVRSFGRTHLGKIRGTVMSLMVASSSVGPYFAGLSYELTGSFQSILAIYAMLPLPLAIAALFLKPPSR